MLDMPNLQLQFSKLNYYWSGHRRCPRGIADDSARGGATVQAPTLTPPARHHRAIADAPSVCKY